MHPWEDWAETFAHYLHIRDTLQTAAEFGLMLIGPKDENGRRMHDLSATPDDGNFRADRFDRVIDEWLPLTYALNAINRSMGKGDLYPFVLPPAVIRKLAFIHDIVVRAGEPDCRAGSLGGGGRRRGAAQGLGLDELAGEGHQERPVVDEGAGRPATGRATRPGS